MTGCVPPEALEENEMAQAEFSLRRGGVVGLTSDYILVFRDGEMIRVSLNQVTEVILDSIDWFLVVMSVVIIGFGVVSLDRSILGGLIFVTIGIVNFYLTYRKRGALRIRVTDRRKPMTIRPEDPQAVYDALEPLLSN
jgi:hypothetical protein